MMQEVEVVLGLLVAVAALVTLAGRINLPYPLLLVVGGLILGFVPGLPRVALEPDLIFLIFLPPLLYRDAITTSWRDFRANLRPISLLVFGLVLATTGAVAAVAHWLIPGLAWATAFVLGAVIELIDAVIAEQVGVREDDDPALAVLCALLVSVVPHQGISWQGHVCGAIGGVVAAILVQVQRENSDSHRLQQLGHEQSRDDDVAGSNSPVREAKENLGRLGDLLRYLHRSLFALGREAQSSLRMTRLERASLHS